MTTPDLILDGITKTYPGASDVAAVNGISLAAGTGEFLSLLGPSGCGKTTLLRIIGGFVSPSSGRVSIRGQDVTTLPPQMRPTAMVFQSYALFPHMTAADNVAFGLKVRRRPNHEIAARTAKALAMVGLAHAGDRYPAQLSGGQQQRVAVARALAIEPPVLLMDEPLGALDAKLREEMQFELSALQRRLNITTIYVTHDQEEAFSMSDRVGVMSEGRILQLAPPDQIYRAPASTFVANFVGRSNVITGSIAAPGAVRTSAGHVLAAAVPADSRVGDAVSVVVRPEDIRLGDATDADSHVDGTIERRRFTGGAYLYTVRIAPGVAMVALDRRAVPFTENERVTLSWHSRSAVVLPGSAGEKTI